MDWAKYIKDLRECGMTQAAIAQQVGLKQPSIVDYEKGKSHKMLYEPGVALIELHRRRMHIKRRKEAVARAKEHEEQLRAAQEQTTQQF